MFEDAIKAAQQAIDEFLTANYKNGMTDVDLFSEYQKFGEMPFIFSNDPATINVGGLNDVKYAMSSCVAICAWPRLRFRMSLAKPVSVQIQTILRSPQ